MIDTIAERAPNIRDLIVDRQVLTPLDIERRIGLTEGNIFQGELSLEQLFFNRPVPGWARYRTPVDGLWMCGSATHPGGGIMGAPGRIAALRAAASQAQRRRAGGAVSRCDVIVAGGGHNGLVCAPACARRASGWVARAARASRRHRRGRTHRRAVQRSLIDELRAAPPRSGADRAGRAAARAAPRRRATHLLADTARTADGPARAFGRRRRRLPRVRRPRPHDRGVPGAGATPRPATTGSSAHRRCLRRARPGTGVSRAGAEAGSRADAGAADGGGRLRR